MAVSTVTKKHSLRNVVESTIASVMALSNRLRIFEYQKDKPFRCNRLVHFLSIYLNILIHLYMFINSRSFYEKTRTLHSAIIWFSLVMITNTKKSFRKKFNLQNRIAKTKYNHSSKCTVVATRARKVISLKPNYIFWDVAGIKSSTRVWEYSFYLPFTYLRAQKHLRDTQTCFIHRDRSAFELLRHNLQVGGPTSSLGTWKVLTIILSTCWKIKMAIWK